MFTVTKRIGFKHMVLVVAVLLSVAGCVSLSDVMQSWVGKPESDLLSRWGAPDTSTQAGDGKKILTWKNPWIGPYNSLHTCRKSFTIGNDGKVERWAFSDC